MSLTIDVAKVRSVLLADGWHRVSEKSFGIDTYEYAQAGVTNGGNGATPTVGFRFKDDAGYVLSGPLSAILATQASG